MSTNIINYNVLDHLQASIAKTNDDYNSSAETQHFFIQQLRQEMFVFSGDASGAQSEVDIITKSIVAGIAQHSANIDILNAQKASELGAIPPVAASSDPATQAQQVADLKATADGIGSKYDALIQQEKAQQQKLIDLSNGSLTTLTTGLQEMKTQAQAVFAPLEQIDDLDMGHAYINFRLGGMAVALRTYVKANHDNEDEAIKNFNLAMPIIGYGYSGTGDDTTLDKETFALWTDPANASLVAKYPQTPAGYRQFQHDVITDVSSKTGHVDEEYFPDWGETPASKAAVAALVAAAAAAKPAPSTPYQGSQAPLNFTDKDQDGIPDNMEATAPPVPVTVTATAPPLPVTVTSAPVVTTPVATTVPSAPSGIPASGTGNQSVTDQNNEVDTPGQSITNGS